MKEKIGTEVGQHKEWTKINVNECVMSRRNGRCEYAVREDVEMDV